MPDEPRRRYPDPREEDIMAGERRISRPDASLPDWEVPDTAYRPIPIVWFTGALMVQLIAVFAILVVLSGQHPVFTVGLCALVTGLIGAWTWDRGMKRAGTPWKIATVAMLAGNLALFTALAHGA